MMTPIELREVEMKFYLELKARKDDFFKTIYPTLTEEAKHCLREEYEKHRSA
jgi:hypothetical protein